MFYKNPQLMKSNLHTLVYVQILGDCSILLIQESVHSTQLQLDGHTHLGVVTRTCFACFGDKGRWRRVSRLETMWINMMHFVTIKHYRLLFLCLCSIQTASSFDRSFAQEKLG